MVVPQPYVLENCTALDFIQHVLETHKAPSWLIICSTKDTFLSMIDALLIEHAEANNTDEDVTDFEFARTYFHQTLRNHPTMRLLSMSSTLKVAFTPDVVHLRAFLASLAIRTHAADKSSSRPQFSLAILNPIDIHRPTNAYSAQGFQRTLAVAMDAACTLDAQLVLCEGRPPVQDSGFIEDDDVGTTIDISNPWDVDISIVDMHTKTFGPGSRGWTGRTIRLRQVVERWMVFQDAATMKFC